MCIIYSLIYISPYIFSFISFRKSFRSLSSRPSSIHSAFLLQTALEANKKFSRISHRVGLFNGKNLRRTQAGTTNWNDERLPQLSHYITG